MSRSLECVFRSFINKSFLLLFSKKMLPSSASTYGIAMRLVEPFADTGGRVGVEGAIEVLADISDVRRGQHIVQGPEGMIRCQGFRVVDVECGAGD